MVAQQTLSNLRAERDYYTTREVAELYHVTTTTVINWIKKGWLRAEMREPISKGAKTLRGRWRIFPQSIEDVEQSKEALIEASRKYWMKLFYEMQRP